MYWIWHRQIHRPKRPSSIRFDWYVCADANWNRALWNHVSLRSPWFFLASANCDAISATERKDHVYPPKKECSTCTERLASVDLGDLYTESGQTYLRDLHKYSPEILSNPIFAISLPTNCWMLPKVFLNCVQNFENVLKVFSMLTKFLRNVARGPRMQFGDVVAN